MHLNLQKTKKMFNNGTLKIVDAEICATNGYALICGNGQVEEISTPFLEFVRKFKKEMLKLC